MKLNVLKVQCPGFTMLIGVDEDDIVWCASPPCKTFVGGPLEKLVEYARTHGPTFVEEETPYG